MTRQEFHSKVQLYLLIGIAFLLPLGQFIPISIVLLLINQLASGNLLGKLKSLVQNKIALFSIAFYLLHLIGLFYTDNMHAGWFDVEVKLSFLIIPLSLAGISLSKDDEEKIFYGLIAGGIIVSLLMIAKAMYDYLTMGAHHFSYEEFSFLMHPSYLSMYLNIAMVWIALNFFKAKTERTRKEKNTATLLFIFFSAINLLLASKLGLITLGFIYLFLLYYLVFMQKKYWLGIVSIAIVFSSYYALRKFIPNIIWRITSATKAITNPTTDENAVESTAVRMLIWKSANHIIAQNTLIGVGTGDVKDELIKEYTRLGMGGAIEHRLNAHNAYYQISIALGLPGILLLLLNLIYPLWKSIQNHYTIYTIFILIIILNFLTESMLETQAGVVFYVFMNIIFSIRLCDQSDRNNY